MCFECGAPADEMHHVVPRSLGGKKTIPLCSSCHGKAHGMGRGNIRSLIREALAVKKAQGVRLGRPVSIEAELSERIVALKAEGKSLRAIAETLNQEGITPARGGSQWYASTVRVVLQREATRD